MQPAYIILLIAFVSLYPILGGAQTLPQCSDEEARFAADKVYLLRFASRIESIQNFLCLRSNNRLRRYYHCPVDSYNLTIVSPSRGLTNANYPVGTVINYRTEVSRDTLLRAVCTKNDTPQPPPVPEVIETTDIPKCDSSVIIVQNKNSFTSATRRQEIICPSRCQFRTSVHGVSAGIRITEGFSCCQGYKAVPLTSNRRRYECQKQEQS